MKTINVLKAFPLAALILLVGCSGKSNEGEAELKNEKVKVKLETVHLQDVDQLSEFTATVTANKTNKIAPQMPVRILKLNVEVGDHVSAGQVLATMDDTNLRQAKIQMENQQLEFDRIDELYKVGGASKSAWDGMKAALDVSKSTVANLEENIRLVSPIAGIVTARNYDNGDLYSGAQPVYVVEQMRPVKLMVNVSESYYTKVKKGMDVDVRLDVYGDEVFAGKVHLIYPTIDPATRTFPVEIRIANNDERIRPGMFSRVTMHFGTTRHVVIPDQAIVKQAGSGDRYVYTYKNGKVSYDKVELGRRMNNRYELVSGVEDGAQVAITGLNRLSSGLEVEVVK